MTSASPAGCAIAATARSRRWCKDDDDRCRTDGGVVPAWTAGGRVTTVTTEALNVDPAMDTFELRKTE